MTNFPDSVIETVRFNIPVLRHRLAEGATGAIFTTRTTPIFPLVPVVRSILASCLSFSSDLTKLPQSSEGGIRDSV